MIIFTTYPPNPKQRFELQSTHLILGRATGGQHVDLDLSPDVLVSRQHARLTMDAERGECWIEDLNSKYGTWVNGKNIKGRMRLWPGDAVQLGQTTIEIQLDSAAPEGTVAGTMVATVTPSTLILPSTMVGDKLLEAARSRLSAFYELGAAIGALDTPELLARTVVEHLLKALPEAKRGAMLMGPELLLKAHLPSGGRAAVSTSLARRAMETKQAFIWRASAPSGGMYDSVVHLQTQAALYAPLIWKEDVLGVVCVDTYLNPEAFAEDDLRLIVAMANQAAMFAKNQSLQQALRLEETRRSNLQRQFSPKIADRLLKESVRLQPGGERANPVTILTSDVRGFSAHSARLEPGIVMQMLNEMYGACVPIIFRYDGMVDKFVGDSLLAVFGCPEPDEHQCEKAIRAAWGMQQVVTQLNTEWRKRDWPIFEIGIGIHTGEVLHGFVGSLERMEYTVIGNTVNLASRYCDGAARGEILISPNVHERVYRWVEVEPRVVRTKHPETEPDLEGYVVTLLSEADASRPMAAVGTGDL